MKATEPHTKAPRRLGIPMGILNVCTSCHPNGFTKGKLNTQIQHEIDSLQGLMAFILSHANEFANAHGIVAEAYKKLLWRSLLLALKMPSGMVRFFYDQSRMNISVLIVCLSGFNFETV